MQLKSTKLFLPICQFLNGMSDFDCKVENLKRWINDFYFKVTGLISVDKNPMIMKIDNSNDQWI